MGEKRMTGDEEDRFYRVSVLNHSEEAFRFYHSTLSDFRYQSGFIKILQVLW